MKKTVTRQESPIGDSWRVTRGQDRGHTRGHPAEENPYFGGGSPDARHPFFQSETSSILRGIRIVSHLSFFINYEKEAVFLQEYALKILFKKTGNAKTMRIPAGILDVLHGL